MAMLGSSLSVGQYSVWHVFAVLALAAVVCIVCFLVVATRWAMSDTERPQFSLNSLLWASVPLAVYFALCGAVARSWAVRFGDLSPIQIATSLGICALAVVFSLPAFLLFAESLVWLTVYVLRLPSIQRVIRRLGC